MESAEFCGSPELEIFSARDLVFPYPAFVLNYYGGEFVASVHTTDRVYNDIEDLQTNEARIVAECGFDILSGDTYEPFFAFVNGVYAYESQPIRWSIVDEHDCATHGESKFTNVKPYSTHFINLREYIDLNAILHGEKGTIELKHNLRGFFPRFVAGNFENRHHTLNITHTYCDNSDVSDAGAYWGNTDERFYDGAVFAPLFLEHGQNTHLVFYPVYSPSAFSIDLEFYDAAGQRVGVVRGWRPLETSAEHFFSLDFTQIIEERFKPTQAHTLQGVNIIKHWPVQDRIPTRLRFGLNVDQQGQAKNLPTNVCFASQLVNAAMLTKPGTFKWSLILDGMLSVVAILNSSPLKEYATPANLQLIFYRESDSQTLVSSRNCPRSGSCGWTLPQILN